MVMRDRPQALFQPRMHPKRTAVEIVSALEAGLKKSGEKSGLEQHTLCIQLCAVIRICWGFEGVLPIGEVSHKVL
jgi:hypothetical protein